MTSSNDTPAPRSEPNTTPQIRSIDAFSRALEGRMCSLGEELHKIISCYQFLNDTMRIVVAHSETPLPEAKHPWHFGLYSISDWLETSGNDLQERVYMTNNWAKEEIKALSLQNVFSTGETSLRN